jgi:predicted methyltransferase
MPCSNEGSNVRVGPEGKVFSFVPAEVAHFKTDPVGRLLTLAKEPGRENVEVVSADLVAMPEVTQPLDVVWLDPFYRDLHTELMQARGRQRRNSIELATSG